MIDSDVGDEGSGLGRTPRGCAGVALVGIGSARPCDVQMWKSVPFETIYGVATRP